MFTGLSRYPLAARQHNVNRQGRPTPTCIGTDAESIRKPMTGKRKRKRRKSARHIAARYRGIVATPLRLAFDCMIEPYFDSDWHWVVPRIDDVVARLTSGRASRKTVRAWCNGARRAPRWFVQVLRHELGEQIGQKQALREQLAEIEAEAGDRRRGPLASARARALMMAGKGAIGARKRTHAAANEASGSKNDPHN